MEILEARGTEARMVEDFRGDWFGEQQGMIIPRVVVKR